MKVRSTYFKGKGLKYAVQIDKFDTWSLDVALAPVIMAALIAYKESCDLCPAEFANLAGSLENRQQSFEFYIWSDDEIESRSMKAWIETVDKMIWSFEQISSYWDEKYYKRDPFDIVGHELHDARIQEGLDLFAKYYRAFWV
jgi:hypothetical protein